MAGEAEVASIITQAMERMVNAIIKVRRIDATIPHERTKVTLHHLGCIPEEVVVLLIRAFLPVHPNATAIQSIGICERVVEKRAGIRLLHDILLPAIVLHGTYDFLVAVIGALMGQRDPEIEEEQEEDPSTLDGPQLVKWLR